MNEAEIIWRPTPKQAEFLSCPAREALLAGSAGSGKTTGLLMAAASQLENPLHRAIILRRTFPMLKDIIDESFRYFPSLGGTYNQQSRQWRFSSNAVVEFGYLDADVDKYNYQGRQFSFIGFDELTSWGADGIDGAGEPINNAFAYMLTRLRAPEGSNLRLEIRSTANPIGPGFHFVKNRYGIGDAGNSCERVDPCSGFRRVFVAARLADNPHLPPEYARQLATLPTAERRALLDGEWSGVSGGMFGDVWRATLHGRPWHVHPGFRIPLGWRLWRGGDDGYSHATAIYWLTEDPGYGTVYVIDELYRSEMLPHEVAERVLHRDAEIPMQGAFGEPLFNTERLRGAYDSSAFASRGEGSGITRGDQMNRLGCKWEPVQKWPGSRVAGVQNFHRLLQPNPKAPSMKDADGKQLLDAEGRPLTDRPGIVFFAKCVNAIRKIPALLRSERDPEDIDDRSDDDCFDGVRYALQHRRGKTRFVEIWGL